MRKQLRDRKMIKYMMILVFLIFLLGGLTLTGYLPRAIGVMVQLPILILMWFGTLWGKVYMVTQHRKMEKSLKELKRIDREIDRRKRKLDKLLKKNMF